MASVKTKLAKVLKDKYQANSVKVVWRDAGVKVSEGEDGLILVTIRTDKDSDPTTKLDSIVAMFQESGFGVELNNADNPEVGDKEVTLQASFKIEPLAEETSETSSTSTRKPREVKNQKIENWPVDGTFTFRVRNYNRPQDGDIHTIEVEHADLNTWHEAVLGGNGTGGFQLILDYTVEGEDGADPIVKGWVKKYCSREQALAHVPEEKHPSNQRGRKPKAETTETETTEATEAPVETEAGEVVAEA